MKAEVEVKRRTERHIDQKLGGWVAGLQFRRLVIVKLCKLLALCLLTASLIFFPVYNLVLM